MITGIIIFILLALILSSDPEIELEVRPSFNRTISKFQFSTQTFYNLVQEAMEQKSIPGVKFNIVTHRLNGVFSPRFKYLQIIRKDIVIEVCASTVGSGFFITSRKGFIRGSDYSEAQKRRSTQKEGAGSYKKTNPDLFYKSDVELMFLSCVQQSILEAIDIAVSAKGVRDAG
jgi:hypothetical protein